MPPNKVPVSVVITTKNEEANLPRCLAALKEFSEVIVVDSASQDRTVEITRKYGAKIINYAWNGRYPKKRQWCLDMLDLKHDWVFFVDADEVVTDALVREIAALNFGGAGYFVPGRYVWDDRVLSYGLRNRKIALLNRTKIMFPVVNDLDIPGMGEIEGHYQPVLKPEAQAGVVGKLRNALLHYAYEDRAGWAERHQRYALWEREMNRRNAWPQDPRWMKRIFKALPCQALLAFLHCYILKRGFLDGLAGFHFARSRYRYYRMIATLR